MPEFIPSKEEEDKARLQTQEDFDLKVIEQLPHLVTPVTVPFRLYNKCWPAQAAFVK